MWQAVTTCHRRCNARVRWSVVVFINGSGAENRIGKLVKKRIRVKHVRILSVADHEEKMNLHIPEKLFRPIP